MVGSALPGCHGRDHAFQKSHDSIHTGMSYEHHNFTINQEGKVVTISPIIPSPYLGDHQNMTNDLITLIPVVVPAIGVLVAMVALICKSRQASLALGVTILRELEKEYLWSKEMRRRRLVIAKFLQDKNNSDKPPISEIADLLDWLDMVALYTKRGVIDLEMVWITLFYGLGHYWAFLEKYVDFYEKRAGGIGYFKNSRILYKKLYQFGIKHKGLPRPEVYFSQERLQEFLDDEIDKCSRSLH